ncbi:O-methyltransferase [Parvularcula sp. IMCC14364]|uniref:O-methyltransferase n=1 Tax=Parvularcula sp. IMCC14364 TaxID=3067902 RepID=UPI0027407FA2|nr:O-methyltransferase [Parvularcula sp. IMCC14364]
MLKRSEGDLDLAARVDTFLEEKLLSVDPVLEGALLKSDAAGLEPIAVSPLLGAFLQILVKSTQAKRILEIGTLGGYSTIWMARALSVDGELVTIEVDPSTVGIAVQNITSAGLSDRVRVIEGLAADVLTSLIDDDTPPFDFIFVDADKMSSLQYLELCLKLSRPGTLMVFDNVVRGGRVLEVGCDDPGVMGVQKFLDHFAELGGVSVSALQTVGAKGYDGFAMVVVD